MKVKSWLQIIKKNQAWLSKKTGWHPGTVSKIVNGKVMPEPETMEVIWKLSGGLVTPNDYYTFMQPKPEPEINPQNKDYRYD